MSFSKYLSYKGKFIYKERFLVLYKTFNTYHKKNIHSFDSTAEKNKLTQKKQRKICKQCLNYLILEPTGSVQFFFNVFTKFSTQSFTTVSNAAKKL